MWRVRKGLNCSIKKSYFSLKKIVVIFMKKNLLFRKERTMAITKKIYLTQSAIYIHPLQGALLYLAQ